MLEANIDGGELEYEVKGSGEALLLVSTGPLADSFRPFLDDAALTKRYRVIAYHQRGQVGSAGSASSAAVTFAQHAADAAALLRHLDVPRAHVVGHSTGAVIALQLALDHPRLVHSLVLLEPPLPAAPSAGAFFEKAGPALAAYAAGDREGAMAKFLSVVSGLEWEACRSAIDTHVPDGIAQAVKDADTLFAGYLVALPTWQFGATQASRIDQPLLSVLGTRTDQWFADSHELLHEWFPTIDVAKIDGLGHLLHMQRPEQVLTAVGGWLERHPMRAA